jgi:Ca2+-binding EF-hand superfamily protein/antitoxin component of RelBE/YafQ-DinJ toxin-antitoxin module
MRRHEKQSESLEVRLGFDAKQAFMEACREKGLTASEVVRDFVQTYPAAAATRPPLGTRIQSKLTEFPMNFAASAAMMAVLGASALLPSQTATADHNDPERSFASVDADGSGAFDLQELYAEAGLTPDGRLGPEIRADAMASVQEALAEFGPRFQEQFLSPEYIDGVLANAEENARNSVDETFRMLDADGNGEVSRAEFMAHAATGYYQFEAGASHGPDLD